MAKDKTEEAIARVNVLATAPDTPETIESLRAALAGKVNLVVAKAAAIVEAREFTVLANELETAYRQFCAKSPDKGCVAKIAIAQALYKLGASAENVFLHGVEHVQKEASWGPPVDVGAELRGISALGLVRMGHREAMARSADLLGDPEVQARIFAARALAYAGHEHAALPLRTKIRIGDVDPEVIAECLAALLKLTPTQAVPLIEKLLDAPDGDTRPNAALALGESRLPAAGEVLMTRWTNDIRPDSRRSLALAIATLRTPQSFAFLLAAIEEEPATTGVAILEALKIYAHDEAAMARIRKAVEAKENLALTQAFAEEFSR